MKQESEAETQSEIVFRGYAPPTSSTIYTPNQAFDVLLPNSSRGCLRLVSYLIRKTLGWSDRNGNPQNPEATISYRELEAKAGIGRGRVKEAIDEAISKRYVECLRFGKPHRAGDTGYSALYSLKWGRTDRYVTDPDEFDGFFAGNGNLTHIPAQYFDVTIPNESLAVIKVVGVIIRNTIGFQTKFGFRRQEVALSFSDIMRKSGIRSRTTLSEAIKAAILGNHIKVVSKGVFDTNAGLESKAAVYSVNWSDEFPNTGRKPEKVSSRRGRTRTAPELDREIGSRSGPEETSESEPGSPPNLDAEAIQKRTDIKQQLNNHLKQHQRRLGCQGTVNGGVFQGLIAQGIEPGTAERLVQRYPHEQIQRQLEWIHLRHAKYSRTGLLIRAIEHDMAPPQTAEGTHAEGKIFAAHYYAELGGNPDAPLAIPSDEEVRMSQEFIERIGTAGEKDDIGRAFARFVLGRSQSGRFLPQSLVLGLRLHADAFASSHKKTAEGDPTRDKLSEERESEYRSFVHAEVRRLFAKPSLRASFEEDMASRLESCRRLSQRAFEMLSRELETENGQMHLFEEYVSKGHPGQIPDFRIWKAMSSPANSKSDSEVLQRSRA